MYTSRQLIRGIRNPREGLLEVWKLYHRKLRRRGGVDVTEQDWDNLVILDACRYDLFAELNSIDGQLSSVISAGSHTGEFVVQNFADRQFADLVYVSANPQLQTNDVTGNFFAFVHLWEDYWDKDLKTVLPDIVTREALAAEKQYPNKRLVVHYLQPHYPFIGETGRQIEHRSVGAGGVIAEDPEIASIWKQLKRGKVEKSTVRNAYIENLNLVLPHVETLVENLDGKTVITADHGNAFGEWGIYGHPSGVYFEPLVKVPWFVTPFTERKHIEAGDPITSTHHEQVEDSVEQKLKHLGYADDT